MGEHARMSSVSRHDATNAMMRPATSDAMDCTVIASAEPLARESSTASWLSREAILLHGGQGEGDRARVGSGRQVGEARLSRAVSCHATKHP
jgi:hypothetical protein